MDQLFGGIARVNITPPPGVFVSGYRLRAEPAWTVQDELWATALVVESGGTCLALITTDLLYLPKAMVGAVRQGILEHTGIRADHVMVSCTHTHSGPETQEGALSVLGDAKEWKKRTDEDYLQVLQAKLVGAAVMAWKRREPVAIGAGRGELRGCVINRRDPQGVVDPELSVLRIDPESRTWSGMLVNFTCHPTSMGPRVEAPVISPDYPGHMARYLESLDEGGIHVLFANGATGNVGPWDFYFMGDDLRVGDIRAAYSKRYSVEDSQTLGRLVALEARKVWLQITPDRQGGLACVREPLHLPMRSWPTVAAARQDLERCEQVLARVKRGEAIPRAEKTRDDMYLERQISCFYPDLPVEAWGPVLGVQYAQEILRFAETHPAGQTIETEVQAMAIGDTAWVGIPGELFVEIGLAIKQASPFRHTMVFGYTNDSVGYLPTRAAFPQGGYGVAWTSRVDENAEPLILAAAQKALVGCRERLSSP
jgi:neutral ceramidase